MGNGRPPGKLGLYSLYSYLEARVSERTRGVIPNKKVITKIRFSEEQITEALMSQGIRSEDIPKAIGEAIQKEYLLRREEEGRDTYSPTERGLREYEQQCLQI